MINYKLLLRLLCITALLIFMSCAKKENTNFTLKGTIKGLKKGVVYLQKEKDTAIVNLDSVVINGESQFELQTHLDHSLLLYLKLKKNDGLDHFVPFFATKGIAELTTSLKNFSSDVKIKGSKQQALLENYQKLMRNFKNKNLDLIKANIDALQQKDSKASDSLLKQSDRLLRLKYASTINFALTNNDSEIAPYLALYEIPNTTIVYLDTIYNNLTDKIKQSYYGENLKKLITNHKLNLDNISKQKNSNRVE